MKRISKNLQYAVAACLLTSLSFSQELSVQASGLFNSSGNKQLNSAQTNTGLGYQFGVGYRQYFSPSWSIGTEANYSSAQYYFSNKNLTGSYQTTDSEQESFVFRYKAKQYTEKLNTKYLNIPITLQYETKGQAVRFFIKTGVLYGIAIQNATSTSTLSQVSTSGYYPQYNAEITSPAFLGFGNFNSIQSKQDIALNNRWAWVLETGVKQFFSEKQSLYIGIYADLGLNNLNNQDNNNTEQINYTPTLQEPLQVASVLQTKSNNNYDFKNYNIGVKLQYAFDLRK
ncbi:MAG: PorT family protein [Flavobacteriaceae bacterium]|jgi:hypothetical protein|nr:PorT family protein [Flavobacteriaceae bacterium]